MRGNTLNYILITVLILLIFGVVSFGDVMSVILYIFLGIILLVILAMVLFRFRIYRLRRDMERKGMDPNAQYGHSRRSGRGQGRKAEGEVTIKRTQQPNEKPVNKSVGDYVEYEDIDETEEK